MGTTEPKKRRSNKQLAEEIQRLQAEALDRWKEADVLLDDLLGRKNVEHGTEINLGGNQVATVYDNFRCSKTGKPKNSAGGYKMVKRFDIKFGPKKKS